MHFSKKSGHLAGTGPEILALGELSTDFGLLYTTL